MEIKSERKEEVVERKREEEEGGRWEEVTAPPPHQLRLPLRCNQDLKLLNVLDILLSRFASAFDASQMDSPPSDLLVCPPTRSPNPNPTPTPHPPRLGCDTGILHVPMCVT